MIYGTGIDIVKVERIKTAKESFYKRVFTQNELDGLKGDPMRLAGVFAAKEAAAKAIGTGFRGFSPIDIEILKTPEGKPYVNLRNEAEKYGFLTFQISISHEKDYAIAFAAAERSDGQ